MGGNSGVIGIVTITGITGINAGVDFFLAAVFLVGAAVGAFLKLSMAIRREDRAGTLRSHAPTRSAQTARSLVGITGSRWD